MLIVLVLIMQIKINNIVGNDIDADEANSCRLFTDIDGFTSARFFEHDDSILTRIQFSRRAESFDSSVVISHDVFHSIDEYIRYFREIIEDKRFRSEFIETHTIAWPIITSHDVEESFAAKKKSNSSFYCVTSGCALGAYGGAVLGKKITGSKSTCLGPIYTYKINPVVYFGCTVAGAGTGAAYDYIIPSQSVLDRAILHDIIAIDDYGLPITNADVKEATHHTGEVLFTILGTVFGLAGASITAFALEAEWANKEGETNFDTWAVQIPIVVLSLAELSYVVKFFHDTGVNQDRKEAIEKLREQSN